MRRFVCAIVAGLGISAQALAADPAVETPAQATAPISPTNVAAAPEKEAAPSAAQSAAKATVVVHTDKPAADARDSRVQVGEMRISMAPWAASTVASTARPSDEVPARGEPAIEVPANTIGPGEAAWRTHEREDAERKILQARADLERARAEHEENRAAVDRSCRVIGGAVISPIWSWRRDGLRGPVTTTITRFDDLGSTAQRAYFDAAYPRLNGTTDARDGAVGRFGRDATPPIVRIQNDVDRAHTNANKERPSR